MPAYNIRPMLDGDFMAVWKLACQYQPETNPRTFVQTWELQTKISDTYVLTKDDVVIGGISFLYGNDQWTGDKYCQKLHWYIDKDERGEGMRLLEFMENDAIDKGATEIRISTPVSMPSLPGYEAVETQYRKYV